MRIEKPDRVVNEGRDHVGTVIKKGLRAQIYCFICDKTVSGLKHYREDH